MSKNTVQVTPDDPLNAIVERYPATLTVMARYGLDSCCGGALSLREAAEHHQVDLVELVEAINAVAER